MNRNQFPNGGWKFRQASTGWENPTPLGTTFDGTVEAIIRHRLKNPAITKKNGLATDFATVATELEAYTMKRLGIAQTLPKLEASAGLLHRAGAAAAVVRSIGIGAGNLIAWSDSGKVVPKESAEIRAKVCVSCPMNGKGDWRQVFTAPAAKLIQNQLAAKNSMDLHTSSDNELGVCDACACPLQLKVWAPLEFALRKMSQETKDKLPEWCWMKTEK